MTKHLIFRLFVTLCFSLCLFAAGDLFSQTNRGMKTITVQTKEGRAIELYKDSYALVVGNGTYTNGWNPLRGALQDVEEVANALKKHGFTVTLKKDLTKPKFEDAFERFVTEGRKENSRLLFYYAGHGHTEKLANGDDLGYLVMVDAPLPEDSRINHHKSVDMESLVTQAKRIQARHVLFVFDSCFSGTILNADRNQEQPESISYSVQHPVRQFITAGSANESVPDKSVFKQAFLNLIGGSARQPAPDAYITGEELGFYLKNQVPKYNKTQHPQYGKINDPNLDQGDFVFVLPKAEGWTPPPEERPTMATLTVTSTPSGATVYVDSVRIGKTPLQGYQMDTGVRRVKQVEVGLELSGYKRSVAKLTLKGGQQTPWAVRLEKLVSRTATLIVTSTPSNADVYVDNVRVGKTPLTSYKVDTGEQREKQVEVGLEFSGYKSRVAQLTLKGGQSTPWDVRLEDIPQTQRTTVPSGVAPEDMVLIPAGEFEMGSNDGNSTEKPVHTVYLDAFYMDIYEVTNAQYKKFVDANPQWMKDRIPPSMYGNNYLEHWNGNSYPSGKGNHPVVNVTWSGAMAYAKWAGKRLPTEAEWEKAARGGLVGKKYPWGDSIDSSKANYGENVKDTTPVGSYPPNGYGLYDMAGNVMEWCLDAYDEDFYKSSPRRNPIAGADNVVQVINNFTNIENNRACRGGSWAAFSYDLRVAYRLMGGPAGTSSLYGFRCARAVTPLEKIPQIQRVTIPSDVAPKGMVLIPAGEFQMGSNDSDADDDEKPVHTVYIDAFYMDVYEVTNAQYKKFVDANPQWGKDRIPRNYHNGDYLHYWNGNSYPHGKGNHPVVYVSWYGTMAYAKWADKRLPTEAEWEKAARGGLVGKKYPWGDSIDHSKANYGENGMAATPVGSYPPNGYGLYDMAGNVWEWCLDAHDRNFYKNSPRENPIAGVDSIVNVANNFTNVKSLRVLRGGSWLNLFPSTLRLATRFKFNPPYALNSLGFRCVRAVTPLEKIPQIQRTTVPSDVAPEGMVLIPAGEFEMGSNDGKSYEQPVHTVYVDAFYMDIDEVTNAQYKQFVDANPQWRKDRIPRNYHNGDYLYYWKGNSYPPGKGDHPVVFVSWYSAMAYSQWAGKRLPTEAEWEKSARGGLVGKKYPWGDTLDSSKANYNKDIEDTTPVGSYPPNNYGLYDMAGNVWEWCLDGYDEYTSSPRRNPIGRADSIIYVINNFTNVKTYRMARGGTCVDSVPSNLRVSHRINPNPRFTNYVSGFRCARTVSP